MIPPCSEQLDGTTRSISIRHRECLGVLVPSWRSHRNRVKKQALFRDLSGNGYVVTLTCFAASIDVGIDAKCKDLFTNTTTVPCTVEHDSEECLQSKRCFLLVPVVLVVCLPIASKEGVWSSRSLTSPNSFTPEDIINWDPTSIVAHQALLLRSFSNLMSQNAVQCCADFHLHTESACCCGRTYSPLPNSTPL